MPASDVTMKANTDSVVYVISLDNQDADGAGTGMYYVKYNIDTLSSSAKEMRCLAISTDQREYFVEVAKELRTKYEGKLNITLHKVNWVEGTSFNYDEPDLIAEK